ncbi:MAG: iron chelate uptake ABC transporter family permease subunit [Niameybacter sp.]|uniref:iron chelate uptake ABC transporter family permease subunit n=1 Tax=Niameybacter sp. TaxID=2033640 RepID=UPI002FCC7052
MQAKRKLSVLGIFLAIGIVLFLFVGVEWTYFDYAMKNRIPKILAMLLSAFCIGSATVVFQTITNNHILTPSVLGLDALYVLVQTFIVFILGATSPLIVNKQYNFIIALGVMIIASVGLYKVLFERGKGDVMFLLLVGMIFGTLFGSLSSFMQRVIDPNEYLALQNNLFASFNNIHTPILAMATILMLLLIPFVWDDLKLLDVMTLGREQAINLGVDYDRVVKKLIVVVTILISISTALIGPITFLGLLVVNVARQLFKTYKHTYLIIASVLLGGITLLYGQLIVEQVLGFTTTLSVVVNLIGGLYFIYLLLKESKQI